jgi:hypothetical protein
VKRAQRRELIEEGDMLPLSIAAAVKGTFSCMNILFLVLQSKTRDQWT